jgi:DNA-binding transcriptional ArsR family regulator
MPKRPTMTDPEQPGRDAGSAAPGASPRVDAAGLSVNPPGPAAVSTEARDEGRFAYEGLDRLIHEPARLGIMTSLIANPRGLLFGELKKLCRLTDGNLSRHLFHLQEAGFIELFKRSHNNRPQTLCRATAAGSARFLHYIGELERIVADAERLSRPSAPPTDLAAEGWSRG